MLIAASALLLLLAVVAYRRQLLARDGLGLFFLRLLVLLILGLALSGQILRVAWTERPRRAVVLVDQSQSLGVFGLDSVARQVAGSFVLPERLRREIWVFADTALPAGRQSGNIGPGFGQRSRIGRALELAARTRPAVLVLVSDGQDNGEADTRTVAARTGIPVYTVGVGPALMRNLALTAVVLPTAVRTAESVPVRVRFRYAGLVGEKAVVRLQGRARELVLDSGPAEAELEFVTAFVRPGRQTLTVRADSLTREAFYSDNELTVRVDVAGGRRVGLHSGSPGTQSRFVLRALTADSTLLVRSLVEPRSDGSVPGWVDSTDVFVLDCPVDDSRRAAFYDAVGRRVLQGAGAVVLAGPTMVAGPRIERLLGSPLLPGNWRSEPVSVSGAGRYLDWLRVPAESVPPFDGFRLLVSDSVLTPWLVTGSGRVAFGVRRMGSGRVVYLAGYPLWRWGFVATAAAGIPAPLDRFLPGVLDFAATSDTGRFELEPARPEFLAAEPVRLVLRARRPDGRPWSGLAPLVELKAESVPVARGPLIEVADGRYEAELAGLSPGDYRAQALVRFDDEVIATPVTELVVSDRPLELVRTGRDRRFLAELAQAGGGTYFDAESLPGPDYVLRLGEFRREWRLDPRRSGGLIAAAALLAGLEWVLRRRRGLA